MRRRDQQDTEAYIAAFDRLRIALLDAVRDIRHREALDARLPELRAHVRGFVSARERAAFSRIPRRAREEAYLRICSSSRDSVLSDEEQLVHRGYVWLHSIAFARVVSECLNDALELTGRGELRAYQPENNEKYPLRDWDDRPLEVREIASESFWSASGKRYSSGGVMPFVSREITEERRARLYDGLSCRKIEQRDLRRRGESSLIGGDGVFFARAYDDECMGVYGGRRGRPNSVRNAAYRVTVLDPESNAHIEDIDGDNILSKMNTSFRYDLFGLPYAQRASGYSADLALFRIVYADGRSSVLHAFFGTGQRGEEARWNYWYSPSAVRRFFRPRRPMCVVPGDACEEAAAQLAFLFADGVWW